MVQGYEQHINGIKGTEEISMETRNKAFMHPKKLGVYLFAVSITMIFAALSSALIVRKAEGNWLWFELPDMFLWSTVAIVASSVTLFIAQKAVKKDHLSQVNLGLLLTFGLSLVFGLFQAMAYMDLVDAGIFFGGVDLQGNQANPSGSFVYVLTGVHVFHVVIGIIYLLIVMLRSFNGQFSSQNSLAIEMCAIYWHFLMFLWVYLYLFLYFYH